MGETIGKGSFGKVKVATHTITNEKVAVKMINNSKISNAKTMRKIQREVKILKLFQHPHIVRLYEVIPTNSDVFIAQEYASNGELYEHIVKNGKLPEAQARRYFQQIMSGVEYCHHFRVVHRDLKPENVLLDSQWNVKIIDFGLSNLMRDGDFLLTSCGSPNYAAPEVISGKLYAGPEVDVWSCGVILFALLCGHLPFDEETIPALFSKIRKGIFVVPTHVSPEARDLLIAILQVDPLKRLTTSQIRHHAWFAEQIPPYLEWEPTEFERSSTVVDEEVIQNVATKLGINPEVVRGSVTKNVVEGDAFVAYQILRDQKARQLFQAELANESGTLNRSHHPSSNHSQRLPITAAQAVSGISISTTPMLGTSPVMYTLLGNATMKHLYNSSTNSADHKMHVTGTTPSSRVVFAIGRSPGLGGSLPGSMHAGSLTNTSLSVSAARQQSGSVIPLDSQYSPEEMSYFTHHHYGWRLGVMTDLTSQQIMNEIYDCLVQLNCEWRVKTNFSIVFRPMGYDSTEGPMINIVVYRLHDRHDRGYLIDFNIVSSQSMLRALEVTAAVFTAVSSRIG